ncbi:hypothetical protein jhhlp_007269 [Lomentospora prolificans]|uniref:Borealin N-terminal domain-containing protein n=1 Tax=Lomentospora prolificans TaxID=41688 RepID=A0A2N3N271_9PEZI|nr:hypothetical protein jhhlp_007269 [Lomentospora prolificans]
MAPIRTKKRVSGEPQARTMTVPTKMGTPTRTPHNNRSPIKKRQAGLTIAQKQALIDNLQLEITERARRLRAQYNLQAQGLRSRIEIRVNRIPISLRKMTMGDLLAKFEQQQQQQHPAATLTRPPPLPAKDLLSRLSPQKSTQSLAYSSYKSNHGYKRSSEEFVGPDKENELGIENPKKRARGPNIAASEQAQILSPTSSNSRLTPRKRAPPSPTKSLIARPASPTKPTTALRGAGLLSSMVEKAKATRAAGVRKATTTSTISSSSSSAATSSATATATARGRRTGAATARTTAARGTRRISGSSNASNESTSTVVRKTTRAPAARKTVTATAAAKRNATAGTATKRTAATKTTATSAPTSSRVLRKRG